jgi:PAS domain S-box-containing protein
MAEVYRWLYVDTGDGIPEIGKRLLEEKGDCSVTNASSVDEALQLLDREHFHAIISGYRIPGIDGLSLLKEVRKRNLEIPFILFTSNGSEEVAIEALNEGANFYVPKRGDSREQFTAIADKIQALLRRCATDDTFKESEEFLRTVINSIQIGIVTIDTATHRILDVNPKAESMIGAGREEIIGCICHRFICPSEKGMCPVTDLGQNVDLSERVLLTKKGEKIILLKSVVRAGMSGKDVLIESFIDLSEHIKAQKALEQAKKKLNLLNYVTFNDIQNHVSILWGYQQFMKDMPMEESIESIVANEGEVLDKISHSLKFAQSYQDLGFKPAKWQNVSHVFLMAISHLDFRTVRHTLLLEDLEIFADPLLEQVFHALAENILIHGKTATDLKFWYTPGPDSITLLFEDNGVGIPEGNKEKIFSQDFQNKKGVGLFLAREVLEITGMTIYETGEPGKGARFEITVPNGTWRIEGQEP